jgi:hypothetical protein
MAIFTPPIASSLHHHLGNVAILAIETIGAT